jgi:ribosomal protein S12 methylthiotransferase accessory factor
VFGVRSGDRFGLALRIALGESVTFQDELPEGEPPLGLAFAIHVCHAADSADDDAEFDAWAWAAALPSLRVQVRPAEALVGPLVLPGRAGCGFCARRRMAAAAAAARFMGEDPSIAESGGDLSERVASLLAEQICGGSELLDHVLVIQALSGRTSRHRVIPLSHCPVCGGAAAHPGEPSPIPGNDASAADVLAALAGWVDPRTGIVSRLIFESVEHPIVVTASPPHVYDDAGSLRRLPVGWGKGLDIASALRSAVGEAIERYAASQPDADRIVWHRVRDLTGEVLDPREFSLYSDDQYGREGFPFTRFDPEICHPWVRGQWLNGGTPVWVPAIFVFLSLAMRREHNIYQGTSNGLAAGADFENAALRATLELVERDAFMASWLTASAGRRIELDDALQSEVRQVVEEVEKMGACVELYLLELSACGTAVLALALGDGEQYPGATIGIGADLDAFAALRQAILELGQTATHLRRLMSSSQSHVPEHPEQVREMVDHAAFFFPKERASAFDRLRGPHAAGRRLRELGSPLAERSISRCAALLNAEGVRVALVDVTPPDVATGPFRVVRAVSPDLQPISYGYGFDLQPVPRIRRIGLATDIPPIHPIW